MRRNRMKRVVCTVFTLLVSNKDTFKARTVHSETGKNVQQYDMRYLKKGGRKIIFRYADGTISNAYIKENEEVKLISSENFKVWSF